MQDAIHLLDHIYDSGNSRLGKFIDEEGRIYLFWFSIICGGLNGIENFSTDFCIVFIYRVFISNGSLSLI